MPVHEPQQLHQLLSTALSNNDLKACLALYEPAGALAKRGGGTAVGAEQIAAEIGPFVASKGTLTVTTTRVVSNGDIALLHSRGSYRGVAPDGSAIEIPEHPSFEVAHRQADGTWLFVVNDPWGAGAA